MNCLSTNKWIIQSVAEHASNDIRLLQLLIDKVPTDDELTQDTKDAVVPMLHAIFDGTHAAIDTCASLLDVINELDKLTPNEGITYFNFNSAKAKKPVATEEIIEPEFPRF